MNELAELKEELQIVKKRLSALEGDNPSELYIKALAREVGKGNREAIWLHNRRFAKAGKR